MKGAAARPDTLPKRPKRPELPESLMLRKPTPVQRGFRTGGTRGVTTQMVSDQPVLSRMSPMEEMSPLLP